MAPARELVREGKIDITFTRARSVFHKVFAASRRQMFGRRPRARRDESPMKVTEAVAVLCPLISKADGAKLETALLAPADALASFRIGIGALTGGWRKDPNADFRVCTTTEIYGRHDVPAVLDGETISLPSRVRITTLRRAARVIALEDVGELGSGK